MKFNEADFIEYTLNTAIEWSDYADDYFQQKHNLKADKENVKKAIQILNDIKNRTCESYKYNTFQAEFAHNCEHDDVFDSYEGSYLIPYDFCCNRWEGK